jgi:hypothetical protein
VGKEKSRFRVFTKKQLEKFFEVYRNAAIYPNTELPSVNEVAHKCKLAHKTVKRLRDKYGWEVRRLKIVSEAEAELDKKRVASTVSKVSIYEYIENAGLNFLLSRIHTDKKTGKVVTDLKPAEVIALGRHAGLLRGDPDSRADFTKDGVPIKVILNLGDNGMIRDNGKTDKDNG